MIDNHLPPTPAPEDIARRDPTPRPARPQGEAKTLSNGAVVTLVGGGALKEKSANGDYVELEGPNGAPLLVGAKAHVTVKRYKNGDVSIGKSNTISATIWAVNNAVNADQSMTLTGSIVAHDIRIGQGSTLALRNGCRNFSVS